MIARELPTRIAFTLPGLALAAGVLATVLAGCSSGDVAVGANASGQKLVQKKDGGPTGNGTTCSWDDVVSVDSTGATTTTPAPGGPFKVGDTFKSPDGCNDCTCTAQGITCGEKACPAPPGGGATCTYGGRQWPVGPMPSLDNCNSCSCTAQGIACTEMACNYTCPAEKTIDCMPQVPDANLAKCYGPYHDWIAKNCGVTFAL